MVASRVAPSSVALAVSKVVAGGSTGHHTSPRQPTWAQFAGLLARPEHSSIHRRRDIHSGEHIQSLRFTDKELYIDHRNPGLGYDFDKHRNSMHTKKRTL